MPPLAAASATSGTAVTPNASSATKGAVSRGETTTPTDAAAAVAATIKAVAPSSRFMRAVKARGRLTATHLQRTCAHAPAASQAAPTTTVAQPVTTLVTIVAATHM